MVIWIDGTYGVGKSSIASELQSKYSDSVLLKSDVLWKETMREIVEEANAKNCMPGFRGLLPQNNMRFLQSYAKKIKDESLKHLFVIVDMALTQIESRDCLFVPLAENLENNIHFILCAKEEEIKKRVREDNNRDKGLALDYLKKNIVFLENNYPDAYRIETSDKTVTDVTAEIMCIVDEKMQGGRR